MRNVASKPSQTNMGLVATHDMSSMSAPVTAMQLGFKRRQLLSLKRRAANSPHTITYVYLQMPEACLV